MQRLSPLFLTRLALYGFHEKGADGTTPAGKHHAACPYGEWETSSLLNSGSHGRMVVLLAFISRDLVFPGIVEQGLPQSSGIEDDLFRFLEEWFSPSPFLTVHTPG